MSARYDYDALGRQILAFARFCVRTCGMFPSYSEIMDELGVGREATFTALSHLVRDGFLERIPDATGRAFRFVVKRREPSVSYEPDHRQGIKDVLAIYCALGGKPIGTIGTKVAA